MAADGERTVGEALIGLLEGYGVELVFGIPGVHTLELYRALPSSRIRHVLTRHEQGAAFMADGYARASGKPGVCFVITGPGVTNAATAIGEAYSDSIPVLMISTVNQRATLGMGLGQLHEMKDQRALTSAITGFSATAHSAAEVPELIARAFQLFASSRPRPVHIEIPIDVMDLPAEGDWQPRPLAGPPAPSAAAAAQAATLLTDAKRPLILAGGGAIRAGVPLRALAERLQAPVVTTIAAKGLMPPGDALDAGQCLVHAEGRRLLKEADCALVVGSELAETDHWSDDLAFGGALIRIDLDPEKLSGPYPATLAMQADAGLGLEAILAALDESEIGKRDDAWGRTRAQAVRQALGSGDDALRAKHRSVLELLARMLPQEAIVVSDMTQIAYSGNVMYPAQQPGGWLHPCGYGTLGYGLPAAIGARLGAAARPVVALVGDHGLLYTVQDLATAIDEKVPLVILLWHNNALGQIRDNMVEIGMQQIAVTPLAPDYLMLARAFGAKAETALSLEELEGKLHDALAAKDVTLIELREQHVQ